MDNSFTSIMTGRDKSEIDLLFCPLDFLEPSGLTPHVYRHVPRIVSLTSSVVKDRDQFDPSHSVGTCHLYPLQYLQVEVHWLARCGLLSQDNYWTICPCSQLQSRKQGMSTSRRMIFIIGFAVSESLKSSQGQVVRPMKEGEACRLDSLPRYFLTHEVHDHRLPNSANQLGGPLNRQSSQLARDLPSGSGRG